MDCGMKSHVTESECYERGCCWNIATEGDDQTPVKGLPWCFYPGGDPQCALAQAEKDADIVVKAATEEYHSNGDYASLNAYQKACLARGDHFYSFYLTPEYWSEGAKNQTPAWASTNVTLVKYQCNAAKCSNEKEIARMMVQIGAEQNRETYASGEHASLRFDVTDYSYITKGDTPVDPDPAPSPPPPRPPPPAPPSIDKIYGMSTVGAIAMASLSIMLIGTTGMAFHFYRQLPENNGGLLDLYKRDSFPTADDAGSPPQKHAALCPNMQVRDSLLNSAV